MNTSNFARLKELFRRAAAGQELTIGFLGGSITQGSLSTQPGNAYAFRVYQWFVDTFPQSKFHYVNGGIGGTSSHYGVARAVTDVLMYQPDFVAVDFSVNDLEVPFRQETYEGVVRKLLTWPSHPAVVLLNNIYYDTVTVWWQGRSSSCWRKSTPTGKNQSRSLPSRHRSPPTPTRTPGG